MKLMVCPKLMLLLQLKQLEDVLVVPILGIDFDCPGMLTEDKVLAIESQKKKQSLENGSLLEESDTLSIGPETIEKRTRFSLSQDQESVGASDNLEAVSEAASNHSVASSLDLENENENDNLSDMVSANVSGRGTPNVSGRDTPSSQLEGEDREQRPLDLMAPTGKQNSEDIEDKFGKFEIHPMMEGDETKSMVSDTWSTDVLASDSETVEQSDISSQMSQMFYPKTAPKDIDTAIPGVARSDDTARSEVDGELAAAADDSRLLDRKDLLDAEGMRGDMRENLSMYDSDSDCFKVPDLLCMDMENTCNVEPLDPEDSQSAHEENLSSMQSLGRVSLAVRELPDASDQDSGVMLLDSLQETVSMQNAQQAHRSSIVDILSLDLTRTLNLPSTSGTSGDSASTSAATSADFDPFSSKSSKISNNNEVFKPINSKSSVNERGSKRKLQDFGPEDVCYNLIDVSLLPLTLESSDEILAKYRKKSPAAAASTTSKSSASEYSETMSNASDNVLLDGNLQNFDPVNMENSAIFSDAKCKLRLVLGSADLQTLPWLNHSRGRSVSGALQRLQENELVAFLKVLLAEAINLQQRPLMAHLHEALRCVRLFDDIGCQKLFKSLRDDYRKRAPYIAYLVRCRQGLLSTLSHLETLTERVERDKQVCCQYLVMTSVRIFLEKHDRYLQHFVRSFQELVVADEKAIKVEEFLNYLFNYVQNDPMWQTASGIQIENAKAVIEHSVMSRIYTFALHPNGDGDVLRDKVLHEHMQKLSQVITPNHKDLRIPKIYHSECPWPSAQAELVNINAYKTPRDKIQCVLRCCNTIMNLLSMASNKSVPAADDLMPVLVYVLIKANPPHLLSTVQYVNTFYEKQLEGEEAYWWTQFASGVEFIKNMDYS
ncbi:GTPase-activating protein and VPS9 domain-containing protein 1 [Trichonephila inaurata madagascariensis]|uniref:Receptor-mediated endocytosis protein 6 homolog n=1 Tax=Trichonephila inaurata madagascariensis TaxID=2747483 RepID=A0A8X7C8E5_9ARAC|nr:GTPase-activating protein and VPS9 domain-containing protein 1 [Trichonephila inaurata madagascariensis]